MRGWLEVCRHLCYSVVAGTRCGHSITPGPGRSRGWFYSPEAATATKLVTNNLTASMIRAGHVFDNLMVNVKPTNRKMRERARRIIARTTGLEGDAAWNLLENAGGSAKTAIVMARLGYSRQESERRLAACGGRIAEVLDEAAQ